ncbi:hypothetical protein AG1IA_02597 [Rhizoctonia solani AG-1 IA]|uniref:Uncharacterized protein n=1 Tax=Thanatephorus cucumeris (strain AG1-IA) TaxID=983506 RepID=L8WZH4_THACA|nr:hypothetical protein AG1IA_02597 [Rhizoctonia solani AG-1 IA]
MLGYLCIIRDPFDEITMLKLSPVRLLKTALYPFVNRILFHEQHIPEPHNRCRLSKYPLYRSVLVPGFLVMNRAPTHSFQHLPENAKIGGSCFLQVCLTLSGQSPRHSARGLELLTLRCSGSRETAQYIFYRQVPDWSGRSSAYMHRMGGLGHPDASQHSRAGNNIPCNDEPALTTCTNACSHMRGLRDGGWDLKRERAHRWTERAMWMWSPTTNIRRSRGRALGRHILRARLGSWVSAGSDPQPPLRAFVWGEFGVVLTFLIPQSQLYGH